MSPTWDDDTAPDDYKMTAWGWVIAILRGVPIAVLVFGGLGILLIIRLIEVPIFGANRPITPFITQFVCRIALVLMGLKYRVQGRPMRHKGAIVANHSSWLDIFTLNASQRIYFVSKAEVASWPGIGWLARATGTVFIKRDPREAKTQKNMFENRLSHNHRLLFFPEGTSTDGLRVLPFKPTLFAAFFDETIRDMMYVQPVTVVYHAPKGVDPRFYGWWADMDFGTHLVKTLARLRQGEITVIYHAAHKVSDFNSRKELAARCEIDVRGTYFQRRD